MKEVVKKIICEMICGDGKLECDKCLKMTSDECNRFTRKILIAIHKNKDKL